MANYVLLYSGGGMPETEAQQAAVMQAWGMWYGQLGEALVDGGNPFTPMAKTVASDGSVSDGSAGVMATGYTIIKADSLDAATDLSQGCPILAVGGQITIYETCGAM